MSLLPLFLIFSSAFLHAGWNLLVRRHRTTEIFLPMTALISVLGLGPALAAELRGTPTPWVVWLHLPAAGLFQACYYLGLSRGYRKGDFTVVYPLARALPVLLLAVADVLLGQPPSIVGWLGMLLVTAGCLVVPLESLRDFSRARYWNGATRWAIFTALATVGYTVVDNHAAEFLPT
ncbi:MAG: EamA family transporter, partial [Chloroflexota bacterium]